MEDTMIKICENCSCVIIDRLKELVGKENVQVGCVGSCGTPYVAIVNWKKITCDSEDELLEEIKNRL